MKKIETPLKRHGLVGYFDILGYQNLLRNNDGNADAPIELIFSLLDQIPQEVKNRAQEWVESNGVAEILGSVVENLQCTVFSDTIILSLPIPEKEESPSLTIKWSIFALSAALLQRLMFDRGLPIRGAISIGDFLAKRVSARRTPNYLRPRCQ